MGVLLLLNLVIFFNENTRIFTKKPIYNLLGAKRLITVFISCILWVVVIIVTIKFKGFELLWLIWIITSLCISGF